MKWKNRKEKMLNLELNWEIYFGVRNHPFQKKLRMFWDNMGRRFDETHFWMYEDEKDCLKEKIRLQKIESTNYNEFKKIKIKA